MHIYLLWRIQASNNYFKIAIRRLPKSLDELPLGVLKLYT